MLFSNYKVNLKTKDNKGLNRPTYAKSTLKFVIDQKKTES